MHADQTNIFYGVIRTCTGSNLLGVRSWSFFFFFLNQLCKLWASYFSFLKTLILSVRQENYFSLSVALNIK